MQWRDSLGNGMQMMKIDNKYIFPFDSSDDELASNASNADDEDDGNHNNMNVSNEIIYDLLVGNITDLLMSDICQSFMPPEISLGSYDGIHCSLIEPINVLPIMIYQFGAIMLSFLGYEKRFCSETHNFIGWRQRQYNSQYPQNIWKDIPSPSKKNMLGLHAVFCTFFGFLFCIFFRYFKQMCASRH